MAKAVSFAQTAMDTVNCRTAEKETTMTTNARFDLKMDAADKDLVSRAASLMGTTMAGFDRAAAKEKAQALLERESRVTLSQRDFAVFASVVNNTFAANPALQDALAAAATVKRA